MSNYSLDPIAANCYPDTTVLINKFGICDESELLQVEIAITQVAAASWEYSPKVDTFDFEHYKEIHRHLFQDLYEWAGQVRDVNISKQRTKFCPYQDIESSADRVFKRLHRLDCFRGLGEKEFVSEFIDLYVITNHLHPFREGNGRTQRLFLSQLARNAEYKLDFSDIDIDDLMVATIHSAQGVTDGLKRIFTKAIMKSPKSTEP